MTIEQSLNILYWYKNLENEALNILSIIPYKEQNYYTIIPKIAPLIIEAGSLISTIHAFNNSQEKVFNFYKKEHKIDEVFLVYISEPLRILRPYNSLFSEDGEFNEPIWWTAYNSLKHDRINEVIQSNIFNLVNILGALFLVITQDEQFSDALIISDIHVSNYVIDYIKKFTHKIYEEERNNVLKEIAFETPMFYTELGPKAVMGDDASQYRNHLVKTKYLYKYWKSVY